MPAKRLTMVMGMHNINLVTLVVVNVLGVSSKYINNIHGNTVM